MTDITTPPWQVTFPNEDKVTRHLKASLIAICHGNERIADVLDQFLYMASWEAKNKGLQGNKVIRIKRTHQEILARLQFPVSLRSLISYLHQLNEWGYVRSQPYQRDFDVDFEKTQQAIDHPPALPKKKVHSKRLQEKGCKDATLHTSERMQSKSEEVAELHTKVARLQKEVAELHTKVATLATLQRDFEALERHLHEHISDSTVITSNILPLNTGKENGDTAIADRTSTSLSNDVEVSTNGSVLTIVFDVDNPPDFYDVAQLPVVRQWIEQSPSQDVPLTEGDPHGHHCSDQHDGTRLYRSDDPGYSQGASGDTHRVAVTQLQPHTPSSLAPSSPVSHNVGTPKTQPVRIDAESHTEPTDQNAPNSGGGNVNSSVTHGETQHDTGSYSHNSTTKEQQDATHASQPPEQGGGKGSGKGSSRVKKPTKAAEIERWCIAFDELYRTKEGYAPDYTTPRTKNIKKAVSDLIEAKATIDQAVFVLDDIFRDGDAFWLNHRTITAVSSQYATRIPKMAKQQRKPTNGQTGNKPTPTMTHDQAWALVKDACQQVQKMGCDMVKADVVESQKTPGAWLVQMHYDDVELPTIKAPEQWSAVLKDIEQMYEGDKQRAARLARRSRLGA